jgi:hypothetical protein
MMIAILAAFRYSLIRPSGCIKSEGGKEEGDERGEGQEEEEGTIWGEWRTRGRGDDMKGRTEKKKRGGEDEVWR